MQLPWRVSLLGYAVGEGRWHEAMARAAGVAVASSVTVQGHFWG